MASEFTDDPRELETQASSTRGFGPLHKHTGTDLFDEYEPVEPPSGLMKKRPNIFLWIGIALLLGLLVAGFVLVIGDF